MNFFKNICCDVTTDCVSYCFKNETINSDEQYTCCLKKKKKRFVDLHLFRPSWVTTANHLPPSNPLL